MSVNVPPNKFFKRIPKNRFVNLFSAHVVEFCKTTTIHGFNHIVAPSRQWLEKLFWIIMVTTASIWAAAIIYRSYSRYRQDPTVISIDKNFRTFEVHFPATTFCFENKFNETKAVEMIKRKWNVSSGARYETYMDFLQALSNSSYENLQDFEKFSKIAELNGENLAELMHEINFNVSEEIIATFESDKPDGTTEFFYFHETLTEMGICYSFNSFITPYLKPGGKLNKRPGKQEALPQIPKCNYLNGKCYGRMIRGARTLKFYVHSPFELPDSSSKYWTSVEKTDTEAIYTYLPIKADPILKGLRIKQRKCRFRDESHLPESPFYSFTLCRMNCRRNLAMELCKCVPHFYVKRANQPYCDLKGLTCLSKNSTYIVKLIADNGAYHYPCPCFASCSDTDYIADKIEVMIAPMTPTFKYKNIQYKYEIQKFSKTILKRTIIYGIEDLLVSLGGTANLFLGCSLMSGVELIYFFTLRLARYLIKKKAARKDYGAPLRPLQTGKKRLRKFTQNHSDLFVE